MKNDHLQIGGKIKRLRHQKALSQAQLASILDISPSYLNLIEHNRRQVTVPLLFRLASIFGVEPGELAENDDSRLSGDLMELFGDDLFIDSDVTNQDIRALVQSLPSVSRAVLKLFDRVRELEHRTSGIQPASGGFNLVTEAVSDFLQENANYFPTLEAITEETRARIDRHCDLFEEALRLYLMKEWHQEIVVAPLGDGVVSHMDEAGRRFVISEALAPRSAQFVVAQHVARLVAGDEIERLIENSTLPLPDATGLVRSVLAAYGAAALIMPYAPFYKAVRETRYDIERISRRFRATFEQVCHRMTSLQRPGLSGIPLHLVRTDIAGNISKRFSLSGIHIPRHSGACPRWNIYAAFLSPGQINVQVSQMPDSKRYFCIAQTVYKGRTGFRAPGRYLSIGLGCALHHASEMIYSDGFDYNAACVTVPIGVGCRICPRTNCAQRAHPAADHRFPLASIDKMENFYMQSA